MGHILVIISIFFFLGCEEARRGIGAYMKLTEKIPNQISFEYSYPTNLASRFLTVDYSKSDFQVRALIDCHLYLDADRNPDWDTKASISIEDKDTPYNLEILENHSGQMYLNIGCWDRQETYQWGQWASVDLSQVAEKTSATETVTTDTPHLPQTRARNYPVQVKPTPPLISLGPGPQMMSPLKATSNIRCTIAQGPWDQL